MERKAIRVIFIGLSILAEDVLVQAICKNSARQLSVSAYIIYMVWFRKRRNLTYDFRLPVFLHI